MTARRLTLAGAAAIAGLFLLAPAVLAASHPSVRADANPSSGQPASATGSTTDRDVPGASVDPSKKDHDNGVGNNCDPGFGKGNQAKFGTEGQAVDPRDTGCRSASGGVQGQSSGVKGQSGGVESQSGGVQGQTAGEVSAATAAAAAPTVMPATGAAAPAAGSVLAATGGVLAATASVGGTAASATGAVLADTGTPVGVLLLGLLALGLGLLLRPVRIRA